ncbi:hypothetical protein RYX36_028369 [Vicia faba]
MLTEAKHQTVGVYSVKLNTKLIPIENHKWEDVIDKTNHHLCYKAKSTKPKNGPLKYWSMTVFNDISAEMLRNFYMDNHYRKQWDNTVVEHNQLQLDESDGSEVGRTVKKIRQADVNSLMLILALICLLLPMLFTYSAASPELTVESSLYLSRAASIVMLAAYFVYLIFQLWTHRQLFEAEDEGGDENIEAEEAVIGFWSGFAWLAGMTVFTALLSEYVVDTIEDASDSWGLSVSFLSIILLPVVGNAAEHAGAIIFAFKNKLVRIYIIVPLCVTVACGMGVNMDLNFNLIETGSLAVAIIVTSFTLQGIWLVCRLVNQFEPTEKGVSKHQQKLVVGGNLG